MYSEKVVPKGERYYVYNQKSMMELENVLSSIKNVLSSINFNWSETKHVSPKQR